MNNSQKSPVAVSLTAVLFLLVSPAAFAYLDPSTGSMVVSAIVGIFASVALALKTYWYKIKAFFKPGKKQGSSQPEPSDQS